MSTANKTKTKRKSYYLVTPLVTEGLEVKEKGEKIKEGISYVIRGRLEDHVIVSVPVTVSYSAASELREKLIKEIKKPVIVITHNIGFFKAEKLSRKEVTELKKKMESPNDSNGDRSGAGKNGDSSIGNTEERKTDSARVDLFGNKKTSEEEQAEPKSDQ